MPILLPQILPDNVAYRIPDSLYTPTPSAITGLDFFITPKQKQFYFKPEDGTVTQVTMDFISKDCLFKINNTYKKV
jgi:hypothetical protein